MLSQNYSGETTLANRTSLLAEKSGIDFLYRSIRRHWRANTAITLCLSAVSIGVILALPPKYSASAYLQVQSRPNVVSIPDVLPSVSLDVGGISSEVEILKSRDIARAVAQTLQAADIPGVDANGRGWPLFDRIPALPAIKASVKSLLNFRPTPLEEKVVDYLMKNQDIQAVGKSRVVEIGFTGATPDIARDVANAYARIYLDRQSTETAKATLAAKQWVDAEIDRVRKLVHSDERSLEDFRSQHGLIEDDNKLLLPYGQLSELDHDLNRAVADHAAAHARVEEVKRLQHSGTLLNAVPEGIDSPALKALREQEATLSIEINKLSQQYTAESGRIRILEDEKAQLRNSIREELSHIADGLQTEASVLASQVTSLKSSVAASKASLRLSGGERVELAALQREAEGNRQLLITLMKRQSELGARTTLQTANARLISPASLPNAPSFPKLLPMTILALLGSFAASAGFTAARDIKERVIRSTDELAALVPYRAVGMLPRFQPVRHPDRLNALSADRSRFSEAVKNLYVRLAQPGQPWPRTIMVTSALSGEGKTTTAVSLAMLAASMGRRVALLDFDTRAPSIHHIMQLPLGPGLAEYLREEASTLAEVAQNPHPNLAVLTAGRSDGLNILAGAERLDTLLGELSRDFDHVIIDTPPCLAVADALILSRIADQILHVVCWSKTSRSMIQAAANLFDCVDPLRIALVLTKVDAKRHAGEGYTDSMYYHKSLNRYYLG